MQPETGIIIMNIIYDIEKIQCHGVAILIILASSVTYVELPCPLYYKEVMLIDALRPRAWHFGRHFLRAKIHVSSAVKTFNQPIRRNRTRRSINVGVKHVFK